MADDGSPVPLEAQKVFGAGLKRKRVDFVPVAAGDSSQSVPGTTSSGRMRAGNRYLSIVFKNGASSKDLNAVGTNGSNPPENPSKQQLNLKGALCEICNFPISDPNDATSLSSRPHEASIAHQVCVPHSYPPSHLDRNRQGMKYLSSYGWDPDSGLGLGASGEGRRVPIKAELKNDTVGLGLELKGLKMIPEKVERLDAKKARKKELEDRRQRERLQEMFYRNDDMERYLGGG
ncbi:hypothetical protein MMC28_004671 [Mycoblastus sanguinarius]|nr:hypothetical protein [Mycoblastus sanguinarius]